MKAETKRRILIAGALLLGIPVALCVIFAGLLYWGLCFGVDPMEAPIEKDGVSAMLAAQRMGDQRTYVFVENNNEREVAVDLTVNGFSDRKLGPAQLQFHTVLGPRSAKRIYPGSSVLSLSVTKY